jgi:hypothetical protein
MGSGKSRRIALIRGEPGARVTLRWARLMDGRWADGVYSAGAQEPRFEAPAAGDYLVSLHEAPLDQDSAPLSCMLTEVPPEGDAKLLGRDVLKVGDAPFRRAFNYSGGRATLQFELKNSGNYVFQTSGERKNRRACTSCASTAAPRASRLSPSGWRTRRSPATRRPRRPVCCRWCACAAARPAIR